MPLVLRKIAEQSYHLPTPVTFKVEVNGRKLKAAFISASFENGMGYRLNSTSSDGHKDPYELDTYHIYNATGKEDHYCRAMKKEIYLPLNASLVRFFSTSLWVWSM